MTPEQRAEIRKLVAAAAPGPWEWRCPKDKASSDLVWYEPFTDGSPGKGSKNDLITRDSGAYGPDVPTCEFIITARTLVPQLLDALDAAERERDAYKKAKTENDERFQTERDAARAQVKMLAEALRWYAHADKFALHSSEHLQDRARAALKAAGVEL